MQCKAQKTLANLMINVDGRVWRQVKEPTPDVSQDLRSRLIVMCGKFIANDDCP